MRTTQRLDTNFGTCECGGKPYILRNAKHKFSVRCDSCRTKTEWLKKTEAVIRWFAYQQHDPRVCRRNGTIVLRARRSENNEKS